MGDGDYPIRRVLAGYPETALRGALAARNLRTFPSHYASGCITLSISERGDDADLNVISELTFRASETAGDVAALLQASPDARWLPVLAHGAGAGMRHPFMESLTRELADACVATFRYQFPYMQQQYKRPDPPAVLMATVRAAIATASEALPNLPWLAGGKSLGGRMTSHVLAEPPNPGPESSVMRVRGLVFVGFPLHPPGRPDTKRAEHLERFAAPMLFLQGTRDPLADLSLMGPLCAKLGSRATMHIVDTADHSFHVLKRSGTTDADVIRDLAQTIALWADSLG